MNYDFCDCFFDKLPKIFKILWKKIDKNQSIVCTCVQQDAPAQKQATKNGEYYIHQERVIFSLQQGLD